MSRRKSGMFRGSELPRLLFLVAIVLAGWPMVMVFSRPQAVEAPPPPSVLVDRLTRIVPDDGVEFQALEDRKPIKIRESAAYAALLARSRETSAAELAKVARRDVFWTQFMERPQAYRGVPIHLEGTAKKVLTHEVNASMSPTGRLFEVWFYSDENRSFPYVVTVEEAPPGLVVGHELNLRVTIDAYFLKLLGYRAADTTRAAPMLVGRMHWMPSTVQAPSPMAELLDWTRRDGFLVGFVTLLVGYIAIRGFLMVRKALRPAVERYSYLSPNEGLPPEDVADWLRNLPDEPLESEGALPPLREPTHLDDR